MKTISSIHRPGSAAARAVEFGIDLTLTLENLRLTPEERIRKLDDRLAGITKLNANPKFLGRVDEDMAVILELEAILELQLRKAANKPS
jgi:hypothetical protein